MHHALEIQEILLNIFGCCRLSDLPALARTCRAFKEPALDVLWEELEDPTTLAQCLPEAVFPPTEQVRQSQPFLTHHSVLNIEYRSAIHLLGSLRRRSGIPFGVTHVASGP